MSEIVYLNGKFVPYEEALVPVEDRGNLFADGVYEVIRFYSGQPFLMKAHMERLERSAREIRLPAIDIEALTEAGLETVRRNGIGDGTLYIQVTRGPAPRNDAFPTQPAAHGLYDRPLLSATGKELRGAGCHLHYSARHPLAPLRH